MKKALITGVNGQDGAYLSKLLLDKGYKVYGGVRRSGSGSNWRLDYLGINDEVEYVDFELLEQSNIIRLIERLQPDEVYNLAAQSFVGASFDSPIYTSDVDGLGVTRLLEALRTVGAKTKFYQASTSELFGRTNNTKQNEMTNFAPCSPYAVSKLYAHWMTKNYRDGYGIFACSGILFNHESPLRGLEFVTRKITWSLAQWYAGNIEYFELGNLEAKRDWGYAGDYVEAMWLMLQHEKPDDYVIATGKTYSISEFLVLAAQFIDVEIEWRGVGENLSAYDKSSGRTLMKTNKKFYRPVEVDLLSGDPQKVRNVLGWTDNCSLAELVQMMMKADLARVRYTK